MEKQKIEVSVLCTTFNHENYIRDCLDSLVSQKTNFNYEIIVHDDASKDKTQEIIKEYEKAYPNLFVTILQTENQYSKGVRIFDDILFKRARGKYIAVCEGDDAWCHPEKLQKQYDFMESHPECSACFHNSFRLDLKTGEKVKINNWKKLHYLTPKEVIMWDNFKWNVQTSSFFVRREFFESYRFEKMFWFDDYVKITKYLTCGKLAVLPYFMSIYKINNPNSLTYTISRSAKENYKKKVLLFHEYLEKYNKETNYKFDKIIKEKEKKVDFNISKNMVLRSYQEIVESAKEGRFDEAKNLRKQLKKSEDFKVFSHGEKSLMNYLKFSSPFFVWKILMKLKKKI